MDPLQIIALVQAHAWLPLSSLGIGLVVRALKTDTKIPIDIPAKWRPLLAFGLGMVSALVDAVVGGASWKDAAAVAFGAPILAIVGHWLGIEGIRGGVELPLPGLMKPAAGGDTVTRITMKSIVWLVLLVGLTGCSKPFHAADPTVDAGIDIACSALASKNRAALEAEAKARGMSVEDLTKIFVGACSFRMRAQADDASRASLRALAAPAAQ